MMLMQEARDHAPEAEASFGNPVTVVERLRRGESYDLTQLATAVWEQAEKLGKFVERARAVAKSPIRA
jgi:hypothetical protein